MFIAWWHWLVVGLVLVLLEMAASGGFYVIFFGIAALAIGALHAFGVIETLWQQLLLFCVISVGSLLFFRHRLIRWLQLDKGSPDVDSLVGEVGHTLETIAPGSVGRLELRGTVWTARNGTTVPIGSGIRCVVTRVDRLMLMIQPEEGVI